MFGLDSIRALLLIAMVVETFNLEKVENTEEKCNNIIMNPSFEPHMIIGKQWTIYYAWNLSRNEDGKCMDLTFKNATPGIINRIWNDMSEYIEDQPSWETATLLMSLTPRHEMLLFPDGIPGKFIGVANIIRAEYRRPSRKNSVPLFKVYMKILQDGRYLVVADCNAGVTTLSMRRDMIPVRGELEIRGVASSLSQGDGELVCTVQKDLGEIFGN